MRISDWSSDVCSSDLFGILVGYAVRVTVPADSQAFEYWLRSFGTLATIFLNLIKMLVAPLILGTLIAGIAHMGDSSALGRIGTRAIAWFIIASLISISLGLIMVNLRSEEHTSELQSL